MLLFQHIPSIQWSWLWHTQELCDSCLSPIILQIVHPILCHMMCLSWPATHLFNIISSVIIYTVNWKHFNQRQDPVLLKHALTSIVRSGQNIYFIFSLKIIWNYFFFFYLIDNNLQDTVICGLIMLHFTENLTSSTAKPGIFSRSQMF